MQYACPKAKDDKKCHRCQQCLKYLHFADINGILKALFGHFRECSSCVVDDEATDDDVVGNKRMIIPPMHRSLYALLRMAKRQRRGRGEDLCPDAREAGGDKTMNVRFAISLHDS